MNELARPKLISVEEYDKQRIFIYCTRDNGSQRYFTNLEPDLRCDSVLDAMRSARRFLELYGPYRAVMVLDTAKR